MYFVAAQLLLHHIGVREQQAEVEARLVVAFLPALARTTAALSRSLTLTVAHSKQSHHELELSRHFGHHWRWCYRRIWWWIRWRYRRASSWCIGRCRRRRHVRRRRSSAHRRLWLVRRRRSCRWWRPGRVWRWRRLWCRCVWQCIWRSSSGVWWLLLVGSRSCVRLAGVSYVLALSRAQRALPYPIAVRRLTHSHMRHEHSLLWWSSSAVRLHCSSSRCWSRRCSDGRWCSCRRIGVQQRSAGLGT